MTFNSWIELSFVVLKGRGLKWPTRDEQMSQSQSAWKPSPFYKPRVSYPTALFKPFYQIQMMKIIPL